MRLFRKIKTKISPPSEKHMDHRYHATYIGGTGMERNIYELSIFDEAGKIKVIVCKRGEGKEAPDMEEFNGVDQLLDKWFKIQRLVYL